MYLFMRDTHREEMRESEREAETWVEGEAGSLRGVLHPGAWDHTQSQKQTPNPRATQASPLNNFREDTAPVEISSNDSGTNRKLCIVRRGLSTPFKLLLPRAQDPVFPSTLL